jgi:hypothetical protein
MPRRSSKDTPDSTDSKMIRHALPDHVAGSDSVGEAEPPLRSGLPAPESIISKTEFTSPKGTKYRIIKTTETDPYDEPKRPKKSKRSRKREKE